MAAAAWRGVCGFGAGEFEIRLCAGCEFASDAAGGSPYFRQANSRVVNADGFITPLDFQNLASFAAGPPAVWNFVANAGDGRTVEIELRAEMVDERNTTLYRFSRPTAARATGKQLSADADVRLTVRVDIEDRSFHSETKRNGGGGLSFFLECSLPGG